MTRRDELLQDIREMTAQYRAEIPGGRKAWPKSIREKVLELSRLGMKASAIAEATGLTYFTVHGWKKRAPAFSAVAITKAATVTVPILPAGPALPPATVTVTTKSGLKIEGLSFAQAFELAGRL
jgi:hypothetical protein